MFKLFKNLQAAMVGWKERWSNWVGDREMELSIRRRLTSAGYYGNTAKLARVQLVAVQRPGWVQVYRFEFSAKPIQPDEDPSTSSWMIGYGLVTEDARKNKSDVKLFQSQSQWIAAWKAAANGD